MRNRSICFRYESVPLLTILFFLSIVIEADSLHASPVKPQRLIPSALLRWPGNGSPYSLLVDKSKQKIFVYHHDNISIPEKVFRCSTGENNGPKTKRDDKKTPEGIYFFTNAYEKEDLAPIYGVRAFPINYPNRIDKKEGKYGYGIWFHGTNRSLKPRDTNGCIVLDNHDIEQLASYITLHKTPVIICSKIDMVHPLRLEQESRLIEEIIEGWRKSWEEEDIEQYISFYHKAFSGNRMNKQQWKNYKSGLAKRYRQIRVGIQDLQLLSNDGLVLAIFTQRFKADGFESLGEKTLYFKKNSNQWKIFGEFFKGKERKIGPIKEPFITSLDDINEFIALWKFAWERKDLDVYISCYDKDFVSRGMGLMDWKKYKQDLNEKYGTILVNIQDLKITIDTDHTAWVYFKQYYQADEYQDIGIKRLYLIKKGKNWKIKREVWIPQN